MKMSYSAPPQKNKKKTVIVRCFFPLFYSFALFIDCISDELWVDFLVLYKYKPSGHMITCDSFLWISYPTTSKQAFEMEFDRCLGGLRRSFVP
jgi:hypothetical protein